jgi:hypothetical protein
MHSNVPNATGIARFSIDFVNIEDTRTSRGAPNSARIGRAMRDYVGVCDFSNLPEHIIALYDNEVPEDGIPHCKAVLR